MEEPVGPAPVRATRSSDDRPVAQRQPAGGNTGFLHLVRSSGITVRMPMHTTDGSKLNYFVVCVVCVASLQFS